MTLDCPKCRDVLNESASGELECGRGRMGLAQELEQWLRECTIGINKQRHEKRVLRWVEVSAENISLPLARQAALVRRETSGRKVEVVALVTSLPPADLDTTAWLRANRQHWGIENGLHQRLDASHNDDCYRVRTRQSLWFMGLCRRFSNSLFCHWRPQFKKPHHKTTTDFFNAMGAEHCTPAIHTLNAAKPGMFTRP